MAKLRSCEGESNSFGNPICRRGNKALIHTHVFAEHLRGFDVKLKQHLSYFGVLATLFGRRGAPGDLLVHHLDSKS